MSAVEDYRDREYFMDNVMYVHEGKPTPIRDLTWALVQPCGCVSGVHLIVEDARTEREAFRMFARSAAMDKKMRQQGCRVEMRLMKDVVWEKCPHDPPWGIPPVPCKEGYAWASTWSTRSLHQVPLTAIPGARMGDNEWTEPPGHHVSSLCGRADDIAIAWSVKYRDNDAKVECASCLKAATHE